MSEKFEKIVNAPHRAFGRAKDKLIRQKWPEDTKMRAGHMAKISGLGLAQFISWVTKYFVLDNHLTRKLEDLFAKMRVVDKNNQEKLWRKFIKNNPNFIGHIVYYMMIVLTAAGVDLSKDDNPVQETVKEWTVDSNNDEENSINLFYKDSSIKDINNTVAHLKAISTNQPRSQFVKQTLDEYWNEIAVVLTELETYRAVPKLQAGESRYTNGLGLTWYYWYDDKGVLHQRANQKNNTPKLIKSQVYEQVRRHLIKETLPALYNAIKDYDNITPQMRIALIMVGYQRSTDMKYIAKKLSVAKNVQEVADAFADVSSVPKKWRQGTLIRRYTCAMYAIGAISTEQFLDWSRDSFSMININTVYKNGHFIISQENIEYLLSRSRSSNDTVREFLSDFGMGHKIVTDIKSLNKKFNFDKNANDSIYEKSMAMVNKADRKFKKAKYKEAERLYTEALELNPDNMEAYSSLALTYKKLGDQYKSEEYYQKCIKVVVDCNGRMNSNRNVLLDHRVKAMTYYNAGLARQEIGHIAKESGDFKKAKEQYLLAQKNFRTAKENAKMVDMDVDILELYEHSMEGIKKNIDAIKKLAFVESSIKLKNKSSIMDLSKIHIDKYKA